MNYKTKNTNHNHAVGVFDSENTTRLALLAVIDVVAALKLRHNRKVS